MDAKRAARMRALGYSNAQIAEQLGKPVDRVPKLIELGLRYIQNDGEAVPEPDER